VTCFEMNRAASALADPTRRDILCLVKETPQTAGAIAAAFSISRPAISRHLRVLREAGLLVDEPHGGERFYRLRLESLQPLEDYLTRTKWLAPFRAGTVSAL
jgi:DNA-binding transcriptional ArsR family regulator